MLKVTFTITFPRHMRSTSYHVSITICQRHLCNTMLMGVATWNTWKAEANTAAATSTISEAFAIKLHGAPEQYPANLSYDCDRP